MESLDPINHKEKKKTYCHHPNLAVDLVLTGVCYVKSALQVLCEKCKLS